MISWRQNKFVYITWNCRLELTFTVHEQPISNFCKHARTSHLLWPVILTPLHCAHAILKKITSFFLKRQEKYVKTLAQIIYAPMLIPNQKFHLGTPTSEVSLAT